MNPHVARLDRQLRLHGEPVVLRHQIAAVPRHIVRTKGIIKTFGVERLIGAITQTNYLVILSPTDLRRDGFPGAEPETIPSGILPGADPVVPRTTGSLWFRGRFAGIQSVDAIYDGAEVVRIELRVVS